MLCDKCKKHEACYHSTLVINGEVKSTHLCEECATKEGVLNKTFEEEIEDIVKRIQPYTENKIDNIEFKVENQKKALTKEQKLTNLKADLQKAIKEERYEDAGVINKEIKKLTKELQGE